MLACDFIDEQRKHRVANLTLGDGLWWVYFDRETGEVSCTGMPNGHDGVVRHDWPTGHRLFPR